MRCVLFHQVVQLVQLLLERVVDLLESPNLGELPPHAGLDGLLLDLGVVQNVVGIDKELLVLRGLRIKWNDNADNWRVPEFLLVAPHIIPLPALPHFPFIVQVVLSIMVERSHRLRWSESVPWTTSNNRPTTLPR